MKLPLFLASASPRRIELLTQFKIPFTSIPNKLEVEPTINPKKDISTQLCDLAWEKATLSSIGYKGWVLSADTIVILHGEILGKPKSKKEAFNMLKSLSGQKHEVMSAFCFYNTEDTGYLSHSDTASVRFSTLCDEDIKSYILNKNPLDKAGAYGIQDVPSHFIDEVDGNYHTIMGLPMDSLLQFLRDYDIV
jgi:septum formation protein